MKPILSIALAAFVALPAIPVRADSDKMTVYKTPTCGCCAAWVEHVEAAGFDVEVKDMGDLSTIKQMAGVPNNLQACHTAAIGGHTIEGHVPVHAIRKFLESASTARGVAVPGMPQGSPGMPSSMPETYEVISFGSSEPIAIGRYRGDQPLSD